MRTKEDIEAYLLRAGVPYQELGDGMWMVGSTKPDEDQLVLKLQPPVLVARVAVMDVPSDDKLKTECFQLLLELNAREMMHGAYGIDSGKVIISDALQLENLDYNEFQATIDDITLAVADHYARLAKFRRDHAAA